ncbi:MAG: hypothetical protein QXE81_04770 [Desulfurococcaceae archaeon]
MCMDKRKRLIAIVAHCLLNQNTVVNPLASHPGAVVDLVRYLVDKGYGIMQLPCPEAIYLGLKRWWMSREQYELESYKSFSMKILEPYIMLLKELTKDGCRYILIGVKGSPSCGVQISTSNPSYGGKPEVSIYPESVKVNNPGVFIEVFKELIEKYKLPKPLLELEIDHRDVAINGLPSFIVSKLNEFAEE